MMGAAKMQKCGITLPIALLKQVDKVRGDISRSPFIRRAVEQYIKGKSSTKRMWLIMLHSWAQSGADSLQAHFVGYAIKSTQNGTALFIAALAYLQYQEIIHVDWAKFQAVSQSGLTTIANTVMNIGASHTAATFYDLIPLTSSASAGFMLGMMKG